MKIYLVILEDAKRMTTEVVKVFTKINKARAYIDSIEDLTYDPEYDVWFETDNFDNWIISYHIEEFQTEES